MNLNAGYNYDMRIEDKIFQKKIEKSQSEEQKKEENSGEAALENEEDFIFDVNMMKMLELNRIHSYDPNQNKSNKDQK